MKVIEHELKEGSRSHVLWWDSQGTHCSEPDCEINQERIAAQKSLSGGGK